MTGANIPIVYPLVNIETLERDRCFFMSLPLNVERMEGTWVRADRHRRSVEAERATKPATPS